MAHSLLMREQRRISESEQQQCHRRVRDRSGGSVELKRET